MPPETIQHPVYQDIKVGMYYLKNYRHIDGYRIFLQIKVRATRLAREKGETEHVHWPKIKAFATDITDDILEMRGEGADRVEVCEQILEDYDPGFKTGEIEDIKIGSDVSWEATAKTVSREKELMEEELRETEEELLDLYKEKEDK